MLETDFGSLLVFQFDILRKVDDIEHCITTKKGWETGNESRFSESNKYPWMGYRDELAKVFSINNEKLFIPKQTHSDKVGLVMEDTKPEKLLEKDALITNKAGLCLVVQTADCVPVLLYDPANKAIGVVHAGWRGTVTKIVKKTIHKMEIEFNTDPASLIAGIGPSISKNFYEVGENVTSGVTEHFSNYQDLLAPSINKGKAFFDLWEANRMLLVESGVLEQNIEISGMCSFELGKLFFSARRDGFDTGRMASCLMLK